MNQDEFNRQLCAFLAAATTPFHAVAQIAKRLQAAGFIRLADSVEWDIKAGGRYYLTRNDSSLWRLSQGMDSPPRPVSVWSARIPTAPA